MEKFINVNKGHIANDSDGDTVFLTRLKWDIDRIERDYPALKLTATKEMMV
jgi:peptide chain release factor 3